MCNRVCTRLRMLHSFRYIYIGSERRNDQAGNFYKSSLFVFVVLQIESISCTLQKPNPLSNVLWSWIFPCSTNQRLFLDVSDPVRSIFSHSRSSCWSSETHGATMRNNHVAQALLRLMQVPGYRCLCYWAKDNGNDAILPHLTCHIHSFHIPFVQSSETMDCRYATKQTASS